MAYDGQQWMCLKPAAAGCCTVGYAAAKASKCFQAPQADNLYYKFVKTRVPCVSPCVSMAICAAAGTAAVAKCVAPGGATHEQVDVAAARRQPRRAHAPQARQWRAAGASKKKTEKKTPRVHEKNNAGEPLGAPHAPQPRHAAEPRRPGARSLPIS